MEWLKDGINRTKPDNGVAQDLLTGQHAWSDPKSDVNRTEFLIVEWPKSCCLEDGTLDNGVLDNGEFQKLLSARAALCVGKSCQVTPSFITVLCLGWPLLRNVTWIQVPFRVMFNLWSVLDLLLCAKTFIEDSRQMTISCQPLTFVKHVHATWSDLSLFFHLACPQSHTHSDLCPMSAQSQPCWSPFIIALAVFISMQSHPFWFPGISALAMSISTQSHPCALPGIIDLCPSSVYSLSCFTP